MENSRYLTFSVAEHTFALRFLDVKKILAATKPQPVPDFPEYCTGTIIYEKKIIPIIDLRKRFHYQTKPASDRDCIIITDSKDKSVGLVCDSITGFSEIDEEHILPPPELNDDMSVRFLSGEINADGNVFYILNPELIVRLRDMNIFDRLEEDTE